MHILSAVAALGTLAFRLRSALPYGAEAARQGVAGAAAEILGHRRPALAAQREKIKETNRKAQRRYRDRQRVRAVKSPHTD